MKFIKPITCGISALILAACGGGSSAPDSAAVWQGAVDDNYGFPWQRIVVAGNDGTVAGDPPSSLLQSEDEDDWDGYYEIDFSCNVKFADKDLSIGFKKRDLGGDAFPALFTFDGDRKMTMMIDPLFSRLDYNDRDHRKALRMFLQSTDKVEIEGNGESIIVPLTGFKEAHAKLPESCHIDKDFSDEEKAAAPDNEAAFRKAYDAREK